MQRPFSQSILDQKMTGVLPVIPDIKIRSPGEGELLGKRCRRAHRLCGHGKHTLRRFPQPSYTCRRAWDARVAQRLPHDT